MHRTLIWYLLISFCGCTAPISNEQVPSREEVLARSTSLRVWERVGAAHRLAESGDDEALAVLRRMAKDPDPDVRGPAFKAFGLWRDKQAIPILIDALMDDDVWKDCEERLGRHVLFRRYLSETAHKSLEQISGHNLDFDPEADLDQRKAVQEEWRQRLAQYVSSCGSDWQ